MGAIPAIHPRRNGHPDRAMPVAEREKRRQWPLRRIPPRMDQRAVATPLPHVPGQLRWRPQPPPAKLRRRPQPPPTISTRMKNAVTPKSSPTNGIGPEQALYFTRSFSEPLLVIWCGNIIARDCCIARAGARARELAGRNKPLGNWDIINIRMVDIRRPDPKRDFAEGVSVWPEKNTEAMIDEVLAQVSVASVQKECFNNPVVEGTYFKEITWGAVPPLNKFPFLISYGDPAPSNRTTHRKGVKALGSFKSNVLLGILDGRLYVITAFLKATSPMMSSSIGTTIKRITSATVRRSTTTSRITSYRIPSTNRFSSRFSCKRPSNGNSSSLSHLTSEPNRISSPELKATLSRSIGRAT